MKRTLKVSRPACDSCLDVKDVLDRWEQEPDFKEVTFTLHLWAALESQGFNSIRLECLPYESVHGLWRFAMRIGRVERNARAVETGIRNACAQMGYPIKKHFVSARIEGRRTLGGFILKPAKQPNGR
jgi:hypothetical protein